ncbi:unnamed protein product [Protopolystoma xenopodis]|uniref:Uncharacterized protein n=1 Tax=Protopolystoma xenopodis TaxID=117903 RepID=A0A3S5CM64_9PLAT|nr:unnamed protein product [Protopolystoma xenopodis]
MDSGQALNSPNLVPNSLSSVAESPPSDELAALRSTQAQWRTATLSLGLGLGLSSCLVWLIVTRGHRRLQYRLPMNTFNEPGAGVGFRLFGGKPTQQNLKQRLQTDESTSFFDNPTDGCEGGFRAVAMDTVKVHYRERLRRMRDRERLPEGRAANARGDDKPKHLTDGSSTKALLLGDELTEDDFDTATLSGGLARLDRRLEEDTNPVQEGIRDSFSLIPNGAILAIDPIHNSSDARGSGLASASSGQVKTPSFLDIKLGWTGSEATTSNSKGQPDTEYAGPGTRLLFNGLNL